MVLHVKQKSMPMS
ncbi:hypothetical protein F383_03407 [Gossypium arboreum]|nr:hypothetical protein F383_03407 [Gossypium arboreum]